MPRSLISIVNLWLMDLSVAMALRSVQLNDMLAAVGGIANQALIHRIDDKVESFERQLTDQHGAFVWQFGDIHWAVRP